MNDREQRGLMIAALCKLNRKKHYWLVPSQSKHETTYRVDPVKNTCTCEDHQETGEKCKHIYAVEITRQREFEFKRVYEVADTLPIKKPKTYRQDWSAYNAAQASEKNRVQDLLHELSRDLPEKVRPASMTGGKPHRVRDCVFAMAFKVYCGLSSRRFSCDLLDAFEKGYTMKAIPGAKVTKFFEDPHFTPILKALIVESAAPLKSVETDFAIDSSGFGSTRYERWYDQKYGVTRNRGVWVKTHLCCGVKTNVVTAVRILGKDSGDSPQFAPLVKETRRNFNISEVSADKAYASVENFEAVAECGGQAYIAFKANNTGGSGGVFQKAFHYFKLHQEEYMAKYHKRSNVETTFSAIKRKFGDSVMSKTDVAMTNEVLCKILCHNLTVLIQEQETLGITPVFWKDAAASADARIRLAADTTAC